MITPKKASLHYLLRHPIQWLAFGFGAGLAPKAPGTVGTLAAIPFFWFIQDLPLAVYLVVVFLGFLVGIYLCGITAKALDCHDHPGIVWDEMVGYWLTMILAPGGWGWIALGFCLFRLFDIWKPWPIAWIDRRIHGGLGIMLDDVLAAVYAWMILQLIAHGIHWGELCESAFCW